MQVLSAFRLAVFVMFVMLYPTERAWSQSPPTGPAGGDLAGTYPNPALAVDRVRKTGDTMTGQLNISQGNTGGLVYPFALSTGGNAGPNRGISFQFNLPANPAAVFGAEMVAARESWGLSSYLSFSTHNGTAVAEALRIAGNGNVGIGTTSPARRLHVFGGNVFHQYSATAGQEYGFYTSTRTNHFSSNLYYDGQWKMIATGKAGLISTGPIDGPAAFAVFADNTSRAAGSAAVLTNLFQVNSDGNVGIGTIAPGYKLDLNGNLNVQGGTTFFRQSSGLAGNQGSYISIGGTANNETTFTLGVYRAGTYTNRLVVNQFGQMVFQPNGDANVGIGVAYPNYKFDVQGGMVNASGGLCIAGDCKTAWSQVAGGGTSSQWTTVGSNIHYSSGNVGVGTTVPAFDSNVGKFLTVDGVGGIGSIGAAGGTGGVGTAVSQVAFVNSSLGTTEKRLATIVGSTDTTTNSGMLDFYTASSGAFSAPRMRIKSDGNIGIGTTSPGSKLDVAGTIRAGNADTNIGNHPTYGTAFGAFWRQGADYSLLTNGTHTYLNAPVSTGNIYLRSANADKMVLLGSNGNVGIGTATPSTKLHVVGDITVTGNIAAKYQDLAEWVPSSEVLAAGTVVVLDSTKSNEVIASTQSYDTRVAGVISQQPGITLGESGANKVLVATTGRVRVKVDATKGPIQIGDLLVTSDIPGVAMKSKPLKVGGAQLHRPGTLIGKALEPLAKGSGAILVLLSLQ